MINVANISRFKKERFLKGLTEDDFRDVVVRPLFLRLGYRDGRDLCGPQEAGKDAIFTEQDRLGLTNVLAVQTKKGNLNLASKVADNLLTAITQLKTALATSVVLIASKTKVIPNRVYLCASGTINDSARSHILDDVRNPNVIFLDSTELIPLVDHHLPEFWLGIEADIVPYFNAIRRLVSGGSEGLLSADHRSHGIVLGSAATDEAFVTLNLHRTSVRIKKVKGRITREPYFEEFPLTSLTHKRPSKVLILGEAGAGKSTGLLRLAYTTVARSFETSDAYKIPLLLKALDIFTARPTSLIDFAYQASRALSGSSKACFTIADLLAGRAVFLIDSLDELPTDEARLLVLDLVDVGFPRVPGHRVKLFVASHTSPD